MVIINADGNGVIALKYNIGKRATVICKYPCNIAGGYEIGIKFEQEAELLHNLSGEIDTETGYWVYSRNVVKL